MQIFPAIDLLDGRCVRLFQGDYDTQTVYSEDPLEQARIFAAEGAEYLHVVDLNAARSGGSENLAIIRRICEETELKVQTGGGLRSMEALDARFSSGVWRCVIGTAAITDPQFTREALTIYGNRIAIGADCQGDKIAVQGWTTVTEMNLDDFVQELLAMGCRTLIYTDISRDGALTGPNLEVTARLVNSSGMQIVLSGGVAQDSDIVAAEHIGCAAVITGKALYEGRVDLHKCLNYLKRLTGQA